MTKIDPISMSCDTTKHKLDIVDVAELKKLCMNMQEMTESAFLGQQENLRRQSKVASYG